MSQSMLTLPLFSHDLAPVQSRLKSHGEGRGLPNSRTYRCARIVSLLIQNMRVHLALPIQKDIKVQSLSADLCVSWWLQYTWWSWGYFQHRADAKAARQVHGGLHGYHDWHWSVSPALPCPALPCPALPCPALPCPALPCPAHHHFCMQVSLVAPHKRHDQRKLYMQSFENKNMTCIELDLTMLNKVFLSQKRNQCANLNFV